MQDDLLGQKIVLIVKTIEAITLKKELFSDNLEKYEIPKNYSLIKDFILTKSGKINRIKTMESIEENQWQILD